MKEEVELQKQVNLAALNELDEATRIEIEGFRTGTYLRLEVHDVPSEMVEYFDPCHPILLGGLALGEENVGYMQVRTPLWLCPICFFVPVSVYLPHKWIFNDNINFCFCKQMKELVFTSLEVYLFSTIY